MLGAIIGDIAGSVYEFNPTKRTDFTLFGDGVNYTDDTIMTFAVADWALRSDNFSHEDLECSLVRYADVFPCKLGGYGYSFAMWLKNTWSKRSPYNSFGNGSAMRVSSIGWLFDTVEETEHVAEVSASITHNHPEGIKGAKATAAAIFMARKGATKDEIKRYIQEKYGYDLDQTCEDIRNSVYELPESCQATMPGALVAFLESNDFESSIRLSISLSRDADTLACINGGIAEAYYKHIPDWIKDKAYSLIPKEFRNIIHLLEDRTEYGKLIPRHIFCDIERFAEAQKDVYGVALFELERGRKVKDWNILSLFPIMKSEDAVETSGYYFENKEEVKRYLGHDLLRRRLECSCAALCRHGDKSLADIVGEDNAGIVCESVSLMNRVLEELGQETLIFR